MEFNARMSARMEKRIIKEFTDLLKSKKKGEKRGDKTMSLIDAVQIKNKGDKKDERHIQLIIIGPEGTPYENGYFDFRVFMTPQYPTKPPLVRLLTKIYHPNIDGQGKICLNILKDTTDRDDGWSPIMCLKNLALSLLGLLESPNVDDPLDANVTDHFKRNSEEATTQARNWTVKYASINPKLE
jgi:ubiquitin-conjugating enzyme E2 N